MYDLKTQFENEQQQQE